MNRIPISDFNRVFNDRLRDIVILNMSNGTIVFDTRASELYDGVRFLEYSNAAVVADYINFKVIIEYPG